MVTTLDAKNYGYENSYACMFLDADEAFSWYKRGFLVYKCYPDGTESAVEYPGNISEECIYCIEHEDMKGRAPIYEVMMFSKCETMISPSGKDLGWPDIGESYVPGFYHKLDDAIESLHVNNLDIREYTFDYAFILRKLPGFYQSAGSDDRIFFKWNPKKEGFYEEEEPEIFKHIAY